MADGWTWLSVMRRPQRSLSASKIPEPSPGSFGAPSQEILASPTMLEQGDDDAMQSKLSKLRARYRVES